jgi:hypothetical protein
LNNVLSRSRKRGLLRVDDWLDKAASIRDYRPLLDRKQKRVLFDELRSSRVEYLDLCHKRRCSVTIFFDPNSKSVNEHDIDRHFTALADIKSIYLPRDLDGSLKGTANLVCASPAAAEQLLALFKSGRRPDQGRIKEKFLKEANLWFLKNRRVQDEEFVVPDENSSVNQLVIFWYHQKQEIKKNIQAIQQQIGSFQKRRTDKREDWSKEIICIANLKKTSVKNDIEFEQKLRNKQQCPNHDGKAEKPQSLLRHGKSVYFFRANNSAQARRLRVILPSYDTPNQTVLWSSNDGPIEVFSETQGRGSTISLIVRGDVSDASVRQFLQHNLNCFMLPNICSSSELPLKACDSNDVQWIDFSGSAVEFHSWKLKTFQFRSTISKTDTDDCYARYVCFCNSAIKGIGSEDYWEQQRFRQPISQPILDVIFLQDDLRRFRKLKFDIKKLVLEKPAFYISLKKNPIKILLKVVASENAHLQITVDANGRVQTIDLGKKKKPREEQAGDLEETKKGKKPREEHDGDCAIELDQSCLANLLFSDALSNMSLRKNFRSFLLNKQGKNFWGKEKAIVFKVQGVHIESDRDTLAEKAAEVLWKVFETWSQWGPISIFEHDIESDATTSIPTSTTFFFTLSPAPLSLASPEHPSFVPKQNVSCCYCGCNFSIPTYARKVLAAADSPGKFCCSSHADFKEKQTKMQTPIFGMTKPDKVMARQSQDPARDKNLTKLFQRICELEKLLLLNITVGAQHKLYLSSEDGASFPLRMRFQIRRDEYDGDAHLSFFIEGSTELLCGKIPKGTVQSRSNSLKRNLEVSVSFCCHSDKPAVFATALSTFPDFTELEVPIRLHFPWDFKVQLAGFYGRIGKKLHNSGHEEDLAICTENEGCKIPAEWMRRFLEPEYYPSHRAAYPFIKFKVTIPKNDDEDAALTEREVPSRSSADANPTTFVAVAPSHCFEELWLNDKDSIPEEDKYRATLKALQCFRDILVAESELNLALFSKNQYLKRQLKNDHKNFNLLRDLLDEIFKRHMLRRNICDKETKFDDCVDALLGSNGKQVTDCCCRRRQVSSTFCIVCTGKVVQKNPGTLVASKVIQKNPVNLQLLEALKYFLISDRWIHKV